MKPSTRDILFIFVGLFLSIGTLWASRAGVEARLGRDVAYLNRIGRSPNGERLLSDSLESRFRPEPGQIARLHRQRLGYGDISVVLAAASRLHGGVNRHNIERIVSLWKSPRSGSWGNVVRSLGVRVERVVLQIESIRTAQPRTPVAATAHRTPGYDPVLRLVHGS